MESQNAVTSGERPGLARLALVAATVLWGSSFFVMKGAVTSISPLALLTVRSIIAFALSSVLLFRHYRGLQWKTVLHGMISGGCLTVGNFLQTAGLLDTTPGKSSFLTAAYCILVPFLFWLFTGRRPKLHHVLAAVFCVLGVGLVSLGDGLTIGWGDGVTLLGAVFFAGQIATISMFSCGEDTLQFGLVQLGAMMVFSCLAAAVTRTPLTVPADGWPAVLYLTVMCTAVTLLLQTAGQKRVPPAQAAIIMSLECVFGVLFSILFYGERVSLRLAMGFLVIFLSVLLSERGDVLVAAVGARRRERA